MEQPREPAVAGRNRNFLGALARTCCCAPLLALIALLLTTTTTTTATAAPSPWWQLTTTSRPGHLRQSPDQLERLQLMTTKTEFPGNQVFAARVEVAGVLLGCLGAGELLGQSADSFCQQATGFPATESAAGLQEILEGPYGAGAVQVIGGPVGGPSFEVITEWGVAPLSVVPLEPLGPQFPLGTATTRFASQGSGSLGLTLTNIGDAPLNAKTTPLTITDELPEGLLAYGIARAAGGADPLRCQLPSPTHLTCVFEGELPSFGGIELEVLVVNEAGPPPQGEPGTLSVSGANAPPAATTQSVVFSEEPTPFGVESFAVRAEEEGGDPAPQAGSHPFQVTSAIALNQDASGQPVELPKDLHLHLPPELLANAARLPRCSPTDFFAEECPLDSVIGAGSITVNQLPGGISSIPAPIFNIVPSHGEPARFGLTVSKVSVVLLGSLDPLAGTATLTIPNITQAAGLLSTTISLWGVPGDPRHDLARGFACLHAGGDPGPCRALADSNPRALLTLPASCSGALSSTLDLIPWNPPRQAASASAELPALSGCSRLPFSPRLAVFPTSAAAHSPTGLDLSFELDHSGALAPFGLGTAQIRSADVALPAGLTLNPSLASGLAACSLAEIARETLAPLPAEGCPEAAKIGTAEVTSPLFPDPIDGVLYAATPFENRAADAHFALYAVFRDPARGIFLIQPLRLDADSATGRLSARLTGLPRIPTSSFVLHFNPGPRAPLTTPECGIHSIATTLAPSSGPPPVPVAAGFSTDRGCEAQPFAPTLAAGTSSNAAGSSSPFIFDLQSTASEPNPAAFELTLPPGLSAAFASAATCPEDAAASADCPPDSRLGLARIALGSGPEPLWVPGAGGSASAVYLAGPYRGAPYSLLIKVPAEAGPFDLGTVLLRAAIDIDPTTAQATVRLQGLPQILAGVPVRYRTIRLLLDRPDFIRNPTSCEPAAIEAIATSALGTTTAISTRFQAADCAALPFRPRLRIGLSGALGRNAHPTVSIDVDPRPADANLRAASLALPYGLFIDPARLRSVCPLRRFTDHSCPPSARLGWAQVISPLLPDPERGRLFMVEGAGRLPDIAASLGGAVPLDLHGHLEARNTRIRASFDSLPDVPLSHLRVVLKGGFRGLLVNSESLCHRQPPLLRARFVGHNEKQRRIRPRAGVRCPPH